MATTASGYPVPMPGIGEQYPPPGQQPNVIAITQSQQQQQQQQQQQKQTPEGHHVMITQGCCGDSGTTQVVLFVLGFLLWLPWIIGSFIGWSQRPPKWALWAWICNIVFSFVGTAVWITAIVLISTRDGCYSYYC